MAENRKIVYHKYHFSEKYFIGYKYAERGRFLNYVNELCISHDDRITKHIFERKSCLK